jgi:hypothetical protein
MKSETEAGIAPDEPGGQVGRNTRSSDSEIRCVSREVAQASPSWRLPTHCYIRHRPDCIALPVISGTTPDIGSP